MQIEETKTFKCTTTSSNQFIESFDYIVYSYLGVLTFSDQTENQAWQNQEDLQ